MARELQAIEVSDPSVRGQCGIALFQGYLSRSYPDLTFRHQARRRLARAVETLANSTSTPALYDGFVGVAWTIEHLRNCCDDIVVDGGAACGEVDEALLRLLDTSPWLGAYDLTSGLTGLGVYARERGHSPLLVAVIRRLAELARYTDEGVNWWTDPRLAPDSVATEHPGGKHFLGMAHGLAGVVAFLASVSTDAAVAALARPLLESGTRWLLAQRLADDAVSSFGWSLEDQRPARTAWCHGDPGIAVALLVASQAMGDAAIREKAIDIVSRATSRAADNTRVVGSGLCHGAAGLAHIYNRFYQATMLPQFAAAATEWVERAVAGWRAGGGDWSADFLLGTPGVGLALLAAISDIEPQWDRIMLCAMP